MIRTDLTVGRLLVLVGCASLAAGAFLPWGVAEEFTTLGVEHADGTITLAWAVFLGGVVLVRPWGLLTVALSLFVGFVLAGIVVTDALDPAKFFPTLVLANAAGYRTGVGITLSLLGSALVFGGGVVGALGQYYPGLARRLTLYERTEE